MSSIFTTPDADIAVIVGAALLLALGGQFFRLGIILSYPLRFFVTIIHELGHGIAAVLTGGEFSYFQLNLDTSGLAGSRGGWRFVVLPAGYVGTAAMGAGLILFTGIRGAAPVVLGGLGILITLLVLIFGRTSVTTVIGGLGAGVAVFLIAWYGGESWSLFFISLLAFYSSFQAIADLRYLAWLDQHGFPIKNDAADMAARYGCTAGIWAWLWTFISFAMVGGAMWFVWF
jgi:hypothetical protein